MKLLLGCLLCLVLGASQCFAISGGPFGGGSQVRVTGTYAGLFLPRNIDNSLGLFTAKVPQTGLATGTVAIFRNGFFYPGIIQAVADPDSAKLTGVVNATFDVTFTQEIDPVTHTTRNTVVTFNANGSLKGKIVANTRPMSVTAARIKGDAEITYKQVGGTPDPAANSTGPISYKVHGFKQSESS